MQAWSGKASSSAPGDTLDRCSIMASLMTVINYPRHFAYLALGAILIFAAMQLRESDGFILLLLNGFLHAACVVSALRFAAPWPRRALFAALAPALSVGALHIVSIVPLAAAQIYRFCLVSVIGAASYWCLIRIFWIHKLGAFSLFSAVGLCTAVTLVWALTFRHSLFFAIEPWVLMTHTLCWWLAFSLSLYLSERVILGRAGRLDAV
jgi:hypothetical protein